MGGRVSKPNGKHPKASKPPKPESIEAPRPSNGQNTDPDKEKQLQRPVCLNVHEGPQLQRAWCQAILACSLSDKKGAWQSRLGHGDQALLRFFRNFPGLAKYIGSILVHFIASSWTDWNERIRLGTRVTKAETRAETEQFRRVVGSVSRKGCSETWSSSQEDCSA